MWSEETGTKVKEKDEFVFVIIVNFAANYRKHPYPGSLSYGSTFPWYASTTCLSSSDYQYHPRHIVTPSQGLSAHWNTTIFNKNKK